MFQSITIFSPFTQHKAIYDRQPLCSQCHEWFFFLLLYCVGKGIKENVSVYMCIHHLIAESWYVLFIYCCCFSDNIYAWTTKLHNSQHNFISCFRSKPCIVLHTKRLWSYTNKTSIVPISLYKWRWWCFVMYGDLIFI